MIRLAFVGCGKVVEAFHQPALAATSGVRLTAVVDADPRRAEAIADRAGHPRPLIARSAPEVVGECDAAIVALPNHLHADACVTLLESGCCVLVEKPMATTVAECDRMIGAARSAGTCLGVAMVRRFMPACQLAHALVSKGVFGAVRTVRVTEGVAYNWPAVTGFFVKRAEAGGGVLVDFGSHVLDALIWWLGRLEVEAYEDDAYGGVEAECRIRLKTRSGTPVTVELTRLRHLSCVARIECDRATIEIDLRSGAASLAVDGIAQSIRGQACVEESGSWTPGTNPFVLQMRAFVHDINELARIGGARFGRRGAALAEMGRAAIRPTALAAREVAGLFEACTRVRQPLAGPATPAIDAVPVQA